MYRGFFFFSGFFLFGLVRTNGLRFDLAQGPHTLTCELLDGSNDPNGGNEFRFVSVRPQLRASLACLVVFFFLSLSLSPSISFWCEREAIG